MVWKNGRKQDTIEAITQEAEAEVKPEIVTTNEIKVKALKGLYFHQEITKTDTISKTDDNREKYKKKQKHFCKR